MADEKEWLSRAKPVDAAIVEIAFVVSQSFYFGPEKEASMKQLQSLREPLYQPAVARHHTYVLTSVLADSPDELLKHYRDVIRLKDKHGKRWTRQPTYFWMRPLIFSPDLFEIGFPWYDTWEEAKPLLAALEAPGEGELFSDVDQGWEVTIVASASRLFIRQGDSDSGEEHECVSCDRSDLARQIPPLRTRCERILANLRHDLGHDYWSRR